MAFMIFIGLTNWLVVYLPLWKIWVRQWEGWHPHIWNGKWNSCLKPPTSPRFHENLAGKLGLSLVTMGWGEVCVANQSSSICGSCKLFWPKASRPQNLLQPKSQIIPNHLGQHWWGWGRAACLDLIIQVPFYMVMIIGLQSSGMWLSSFSVGDTLW